MPSEQVGGPYGGNENSAIALSGLSVAASPNASDPLSTVLSVTNGNVTVGNQSGASITLTGTPSAINTALAGATYTGADSYYGADTLTLTSTDTADQQQTSATAGITVNDTTVPSESMGGPYSGYENAAIPLHVSVTASPNLTDNLFAVLSAAHGTFTLDGATYGSIGLHGTAFYISTALEGVTYTGTSGYFGTDTLTLTTIDTNDQRQTSATAGIAINDATVPSEQVGGPYSGNENSAIALNGLSVAASPNAGDPLSTVLSVAHGTLYAGNQSGASITLTGTASTINTALAGATYTGAGSYYGADTLTLTTKDTADQQQTSATAGIIVNDTTTPSENASSYYIGNENTAIALTGLSVTASPNTLDTLSTVLSVAHGALTVGKQTGASITLTGTAATITSELAGTTYTGALNYYGSDMLTLTTTDTNDQQKASIIAGIAVNDTTSPIEKIGEPYGGDENTTIALTGLSVAASPNAGDPLSTVLSVVHGTLTVGNQTAASITLNGNAATITSELAGASYTAAKNYTGADTLTMTTTDTADQSKAVATSRISINSNTVTIGNGNGSVTLANGNDTVTMGGGNDTVAGGNGNDVITGGNGIDAVTLGNGENALLLGNGNDTVAVGSGDNLITLGQGKNTVTLGSGSNVLIAGNGANTITATGSAGTTDVITAGNGRNALHLGAGTYDVLLGNGANTINMAGGTYNVIAGSGADEFIFSSPQALLDLSYTSNDMLVFRNSGFDFGSLNNTGSATPHSMTGTAAMLFSPNTNGTFATAANRFAYNASTGDLYYDAKGNTRGSASTLVANLINKPHLTGTNLFFTN